MSILQKDTQSHKIFIIKIDPKVTGKMGDWTLLMVRYRVNTTKRYPVSQNIHN